jgi:hypothetical protein
MDLCGQAMASTGRVRKYECIPEGTLVQIAQALQQRLCIDSISDAIG